MNDTLLPPPDIADVVMSDRVHILNDKPIGCSSDTHSSTTGNSTTGNKSGTTDDTTGFVFYFMQQAVRTQDNHALAYAIAQANRLRVPLVVAFGLMDDYPAANIRHYQFLLEGLQAVAKALADLGLALHVHHGHPAEVACAYSQHACLVVCDMGYTRHQRAWRHKVAAQAPCACVCIESDVVVPVAVVSDKAEYAARTIRPKIHRHLNDFLKPCPLPKVAHFNHQHQPSHIVQMVQSRFPLIDLTQPVADILSRLILDTQIPPVHLFTGGTPAAIETLQTFIHQHFANYADHRNQPQTDDVSHMSKYLHFGHVSPITIACALQDAVQDTAEHSRLLSKKGGKGGKVNGKASEENKSNPEDKSNPKDKSNLEVYLEELIVRRELPMNFVYYNPDTYDCYDVLPDWAKRTLREHADDPREYVYTFEELETAQTHDPYWNAAMNEMRYTGYMHNYMRMYWGKKILEWSPSPREAYRRALELNNAYFIDGRDPNSFAGVAWVFGQHDRPWQERAIFGKVRYMNANGLKRKAKPDEYVKKVAALIEKSHIEKTT